MSNRQGENQESVSWSLSAVISIAILLGAAGLAALFFFTEPSAQKGGASKKTAMLVDVIETKSGTFRPQIVAQGTVRPAKDIELKPQVGGRIISLSSSFVPGGHIEKGERLMRIEPADYRNRLTERKSELSQAESELAVERGRHEAAEAEYGRFGEPLPAAEKARVLRKPQLQAAKDQVEAAEASVDQARLDLSRTTLEAPFDAHIVRRNVNVGSEVSPTDTLGRLIGTDTYWINVELPLSKLQWVHVPDKNKKGSNVQIRNEQAWPNDSFRKGYLFKRVGILDDDTRMARLLVSVDDPLALDKDEKKPPLIIGEFVETTIRAEKLKNVVRLNRDYVRTEDTVWVMKDGKLRIQELDIVLQDQKYAYISEGLSGGEKVVTTNISTVVEGAPLQIDKSNEESSSE